MLSTPSVCTVLWLVDIATCKIRLNYNISLHHNKSHSEQHRHVNVSLVQYHIISYSIHSSAINKCVCKNHDGWYQLITDYLFLQSYFCSDNICRSGNVVVFRAKYENFYSALCQEIIRTWINMNPQALDTTYCLYSIQSRALLKF